MKAKEWAFIIIATGIFVALVILIVELKDNKKIPPDDQPNQQTSQTDSMDDHHKPKAADTSVFDALLGRQAPDFSLVDYSGETISLQSLQGRNVLLFFNEGLMCYPACWNQMVAFGKDTAFQQAGVTVLNITVDPKSRWTEALAKMPELSAATVLFDEDRRVSTTYGVLNTTSSMHRGQFPGHSYILIDKNGRIRFIKDDPEMAVRNQELLKVIETL